MSSPNPNVLKSKQTKMTVTRCWDFSDVSFRVFPVRYKVGSVDIFVLLRLEMYIKLSIICIFWFKVYSASNYY